MTLYPRTLLSTVHLLPHDGQVFRSEVCPLFSEARSIANVGMHTSVHVRRELERSNVDTQMINWRYTTLLHGD